jgi:dipeptidyl aminopeptidase/acylaminoacyl peptidase
MAAFALAAHALAGSSATPIANFMKIKAPVGARLAPDGTLYFRYNDTGVNQLYQCAAGAPQEDAKRLTSFPDGASGYALSPDGEWIVVWTSVGGNENTQLSLIRASTGATEAITNNPDVVHGAVVWRRDSKAFAYQANDQAPADFAVYVRDLATGDAKRVLSQPGQYAPVDFSSDGAKLVVAKSVSSTTTRLFEVDLETLAAREITPAEEGRFEAVGYAPGDAAFFVISDRGGDRMRVQSIDLASGKIAPLVDGAARYDVDSAVFSLDRNLLAVLRNEDGYRTLELRALPANAVVPGPAIPKGLTGGVSMQGRRLVYTLDNAAAPGIAYSCSLDEPAKPPVALTKADLFGVDTSAFLLPELVSYRSFDGLDVPAFLYLPTSFKRGTPIPFLIQFHGGPEEQFRPAFVRNIQYFLSRGFGVLAPNVRGSAGYGTEYLQMDNYKSRMGSVRDGIAAAEWLIAQGYATKGRIGVYGASYGGYMVMAVITEAPDLWGAACSQVGIVNFQSFLEGTKDYRRALRESEYGPLDDSEFLKSISPIYKVDRITAPLMLVHGLNDPRVPIGEALQIAVALKRRGVDVEQLYFPDEGHGVATEENRVLYYEALARFFESRLAR